MNGIETPRNATKVCLVLVGLPARGKSTLALRLRDGLEAEGIKVRIFNNGVLRRIHYGEASSETWFYDPNNPEGKKARDELSRMNMRAARQYLEEGGHVAILDATNASRARRVELEEELGGLPALYIECLNEDKDLLAASIQRKVRLPEFARMSRDEAVRHFEKRIEYYASIYAPLGQEANFVRIDTLHNRILQEQLTFVVPHYVRIRDIMVSDWVNNLFLVRHGETEANLRDVIGGNPPLTEQGQRQAQALADHFRDKPVPYIFTSTKRRSTQFAVPLLADHPGSVLMELPELDEIDAGICEGMTYEEIRLKYPEEFAARSRDKYHYVYPDGEGYVTMHERVNRGFRKALFLSGAAPGTLVIGHQAVNRVILSLFLYRRMVDVPYIYVPQDKYYHIVATHHKKLFEMVRFMGSEA
ncbi:MAG: 6-phosphofructo-2-kinase/fructose-2,6-bisphosphatase [Deltaproteobacteria bacterium]|jgi:broad specificity phosphatase PhoE/predicted kinase|nr:6-phosphofructo-2-kinase/fructose-2,6-bisphosphatase [Deltaproteobacteria bacterium]